MFIEKDQKMKEHDIFARSFNQQDQKRFGYGALFGCFVVTWYLCTVFKPYFSPLYVLNLRLMMVDELKLAMVTDITSKPKRPCKLINHHVKSDANAMEHITNFTIKSIKEQVEAMPKCTEKHNVPAIVFSVGGYSGNNFHAFSDIIIPLYATSQKFNGEVKFLTTNRNSRWTSKFQNILDKLSRYEIIDIDVENKVHCFPSMIVGLIKDDRKERNMDAMKDFSNFLRSAYSLDRSKAIKLTNSAMKMPRLLIVSRKRSRSFTNVKDMIGVARDIGFEVIVTEMNSNLTQTSKLVNSCDVMMGVHGAGLTNMVFLPENGVFIQVVPLGKMEWMSNTFYGEPSKGMGLKYLEYKIRMEESSLIQQYPSNHQVFMDPYSIQRKGWEAYRSIYMDKQNVKLDVSRFQETLFKALELLH